MITFFLINILAWLATASLSLLLWVAIQPGEIFGAWQKTLRNLDISGSPWHKLLGGCKLCTGHFLTVLSYIAFAAFTWHTGLFPFEWWHLSTWYLVYVPTGAVITFLFLTKILKS